HDFIGRNHPGTHLAAHSRRARSIDIRKGNSRPCLRQLASHSAAHAANALDSHMYPVEIATTETESDCSLDPGKHAQRRKGSGAAAGLAPAHRQAADMAGFMSAACRWARARLP